MHDDPDRQLIGQTDKHDESADIQDLPSDPLRSQNEVT